MIASLRALSARWRQDAMETHIYIGKVTLRECADDLDAALSAAPESAAAHVDRVCPCGYTMAPITGGWICTHCGKVDQHPSAAEAVQEKERREPPSSTLSAWLVIRPEYTLYGTGTAIVTNEAELRQAVECGIAMSPVGRILVERTDRARPENEAGAMQETPTVQYDDSAGRLAEYMRVNCQHHISPYLFDVVCRRCALAFFTAPPTSSPAPRAETPEP